MGADAGPLVLGAAPEGFWVHVGGVMRLMVALMVRSFEITHAIPLRRERKEGARFGGPGLLLSGLWFPQIALS